MLEIILSAIAAMFFMGAGLSPSPEDDASHFFMGAALPSSPEDDASYIVSLYIDERYLGSMRGGLWTCRGLMPLL